MSQTLVILMLFGNIGLMAVAALLALRGAYAQSLRPSQIGFVLSPTGFVLRRPWEGCIGMGLMGFASLLMPLVVATSDLSLYGTVRPDHRPIFWALVGIGLAGAALFWWLGRPMELIVDEDRHTYQWSDGWPPFRRVRTGPLSDLSGVGAMIGGGSAYFGYVSGPGGTGKMVVERFSSAEGAEYYADELAAVLGVPRLEPGACRWPQLSSRKQRAYAEAANARPTYRRCKRYLTHFEPHLGLDESPAQDFPMRFKRSPVDQHGI